MREDEKGLYVLADRAIEKAGEEGVELTMDRDFLKDNLGMDLREHLPLEIYRMIYGLISVFDRLEASESDED